MPSVGRTSLGQASLHFMIVWQPHIPACEFFRFQRRRVAVFPRVGQEAVELGQGRRAGETLVGPGHRAGRVAQPAKDAIDVLIDPLPLRLAHPVGFGGGDLGVQPGLHPLVLFPEGVHVDDQVLDDLQAPAAAPAPRAGRQAGAVARGRPD